MATARSGETAVSAGAPVAQAERRVESVRGRLFALESRVESAAATAASRLGDLARQEASGQLARDLLRTITGLLPAIGQRLAALRGLGSLFTGSGELDEFGMDRELSHRVMPIADFLYSSWWRVEARQLENLPATGPVVVVANHGGVLPWDALVLRLALLRDQRSRREMRPLLDGHALKMPVVGGIAARLGAVQASVENASLLLARGAAIGVFPEGGRAATRPWPDRYRVQRFGRGGFARLALRAGAPVVPCAIVGSEETGLPMARAGWLSDALGMPFLTSPPPLPLAPLGALPLPARWSLRFGAPIATTSPGADAARAAEDSTRVLDLAERVRASLQQMLDEDIAARRSVYL